MAQYTNYILVCGGTGCRASQSEQIIENLRAAVEQYGLEDTQVSVPDASVSARRVR